MESIALYIGKFQPFHKGHYKVLRHLLNLFDKVKIGLGDIKNHDYFTVDERIKMIKDNFPGENIEFYFLENLEPTHKYSNQWGKYVEEIIGKFDFVAAVEDSYDEYIRKDFIKIGYPIIVFPRFSSISGTETRKLIKLPYNKEVWGKVLTPATEKVVLESKFYKRSVNN